PRDTKNAGATPARLEADNQQQVSLTLAQLGSFLREPTKAFFNNRLGVYFEQEELTQLDVEPFTLDGLQNWQLQDQLIAAQRHAVDNGQPRVEALHAALERFKGQGVLAVGAFGERMREALAEPMDALFGAYEEALQEWPQVVAVPQAVHVVERAEGQVTLEDWLGELRQDEAGNRCRLLLLSSSLVSQGRGRGQYRWQHLLRPWVAHLAGNSERPMTTQLLSKAGHVRLEPLEAENARYQLDALLSAWCDGMQAPLPLAPQAAFAWLAKQGTPESEDDSARESDAYAAAETAYEGGRFQTGEVAQSAYLSHQWPNFDRLFIERALGHSFASLTEALYAPLHRSVKD
ncbi:MAG: exodeoxyribonuclease V subunit gamma, partial [Halomonas sp.]|nr:exodeoxyribonuclease V subunit gamma [Halomonas sp.]